MAWEQQPFAIQDDVQIHMYCTEAPCGDASMELTMADQDDATPWAAPDSSQAELPGRSGFADLGIVRRKPSRPDAPATLSKSCSDKLALKQSTSLLSSLTALLVHPGRVYIHTLVLPESQCIPTATERAFGETGRLSPLADKTWAGGYSFRPFRIGTTNRDFSHSKRARPKPLTASNLSAVYTPRRQEVLVSGVVQGRKQFDVKGASTVSKRRLWKAVLDVAVCAGGPALVAALSKRTHGEMKESELLEGRKRVKRDVREMALKGWKRNVGDEDWTLQE